MLLESKRHPLYLHIGHGKVGSSSIQQALARDLDALRRAEFLVADRKMEFCEGGPMDGSANRYFRDLNALGHDAPADVDQRMHRALQQLAERPRKLVISAEALVSPGIERLASELRRAFEVHVIYYVRRQEDWLVSAWGEWGCQEGLMLDAYCERALQTGQPDFLGVVEAWRPHADTVRVRPLHPSALVGGDLVSDFYDAVGFEGPVSTAPRGREATDLAMLEVFRDSSSLFEDEHDNRLRDWLLEHLPDDYPRERVHLASEMAGRVAAHFEPVNRELHARWFPDVDYDLVFGPRPDADERAAAHAGQQGVAAELTRLRRVVGLQLHLLHRLHARPD